MDKIKVLQIVGQLTVGGQEIMVLNFFRHIKKNEIEFHFIVFGDKMGDLEMTIFEMGGKVFHLPNIKNIGLLKYLHNFKKLLIEEGPYKVVHCHTSLNSGLLMKISKEENIPIRISHSHTTNPGFEIDLVYSGYALLMKYLIRRNSNYLIACGKDAGNYLFGKREFSKKGLVVKNGINASSFKLNTCVRLKLREYYDLEHTLIVGHVGRMSVEKNHVFLFEIFKNLLILRPNSKLILVGDGLLANDIKQRVQELGICDKVLFLGQRNDVNEILQMFDVFVLPSFYEGMPVSIIEAQTSGLPCIISDSISEEINITGLVKYISLNQPSEHWAQIILDSFNNQRIDKVEVIRKKGYDISESASILERIYLGD